MYENPITCLYFLQKQNQLSVIIEKTHINIFRCACKIEINDVTVQFFRRQLFLMYIYSMLSMYLLARYRHQIVISLFKRKTTELS